MKKRFLAAAAVLALIICVLAGCTQSDAPRASSSPGASSPSDKTLAATDFLGNTVTLDAPPERIISLAASNTEMLCELGLKDKLVGVDAYSDYPEDVKNIEVVGDYTSPDVEKIISLNPDIVFASNKLQAELIDQLKNADITVAAAEPSAYSDIVRSAELMGTLGGADAAAIASVKDRLASLEGRIKALPEGEKSAYYILSYGEYGDWSAGPGSFIYDVLSMAGLKFITEGMEYAFPMFSTETLIAADPEIIICDGTIADISALSAAAGYKELTAVKNQTVLFADGNALSRPTVRMMEEALKIAEQIWGK